MLPKPIRKIYYWISHQGKIGFYTVNAFNYAFMHGVKLLGIKAKKDLTCLTVISHKHKFIYIGIPKTATRSFMKLFEKEQENYEADWFETAADFKKILENYPDYFTFSFTRNPYARALSCYNSKVLDAVPGKQARIMSFYKNLKPGMSFNEFAVWLNTEEGSDSFADRHWLSQHEFLYNNKDNAICDFVGQYENLDKDWETICKKIGIQHTPLPHKGFKSEANKSYKDVYSDTAKEEIAKRYAKDLKLFKYHF